MFVRILALLFGALGFLALSDFVPNAPKRDELWVGLFSALFVLYGLFGARLLKKVAPRLVDRGELREAIFSALESRPSVPFCELLMINMRRAFTKPLLIVPIVLVSTIVSTYCQSLLHIPQNRKTFTMPLIWLASLYLQLVIVAWVKTQRSRLRHDQAKDPNV